MPQFASFEIDGLLVGLNVKLVQEVLQDQPSTPVPRAPEAVFGLMNLRGQILVAIDLRTCLRRPPAAVTSDELPAPPTRAAALKAGTGSRIARQVIILQTPLEPVALLVDSLGEVVTVPAGRYEPCSGLLDADLDDLIVGAYRLDDRLLHVLDPNELMRILLASSLA